MKNKINLHKYLTKTLILALILISIFLILNIYEYNTYKKNFNKKLDTLVNVIASRYNIDSNDIIEILNSKDNKEDILKRYGIDIETTDILKENKKVNQIFITLNILFLIISFSLLVRIFIKYNKKKEEDIKEITNTLNNINKGHYEIELDSLSEDELSILKMELYKTTIKLKEMALNSKEDKLNLKKSLEDISHQLKTPLTSILIILDNLIDDPDMDKEIRDDFIRDIKLETSNINFLIQALLKLSRFDANTIKFIKENVSIKELLDKSIRNVSTLCDLRNIKIEVKGNINSKIKCDLMWQVEALTNIIKNSIEHSNDNSKIEIIASENKIYKSITIKDFGEGIKEKDLKHIFERFYKGENSKSDSIGIGLSLAKTIINEDNGEIKVESNKNETRFIIKYFL